MSAQFASVTATSEESETVQLSHSQLVETGDHILAFNRFRLPPANSDGPGRAFISHAVRIVDWAKTTGGGPDNMGLDLIVRAAAHLPEQHDVSEMQFELMSLVREELPIGTVLDLTLEETTNGPMLVLVAKVAAMPFRRPIEPDSHTEGQNDSQSGFDREWDPLGADVKSEIPEEELASQIVNPRDSESNSDRALESRITETFDASPKPPELFLTKSSPASPAERGHEPKDDFPAHVPEIERELAVMYRNVYALPAWKSMPLLPTTRGRIVGYKVIDASKIALVVEPLSNAAPIDPAEHCDLIFGKELEVRACGVVRDHESDFVQFARTDGVGYFYLRVPSWGEIRRPERDGLNGTAVGLSLSDRACLTRLTPGALFTAVAVANEADGVTITLLPQMYSDLTRATLEMLPVDGKQTAFLEARIIEGANPWGKLRIEIKHGPPEKGLSHQFEIRQQDLRAAQITQQEIGSPLLVALERDRGTTRSVLRISRTSEKLAAFLKSQSDAFVVNGNEIEMGNGNVSPVVIRELQGFDKSPQWRSRLWEFYTASLRLSVRTIRPQVARVRVTFQPTIVSLLRERQRDIQDRYSVVFREANTPSAIEVASPQAATADEAVRALKELNGRPRIVATLPPNTAGLVLGKEHANRKRLEARGGVLWVWVDGDNVGIVGETDYAVQQTIADIRATVETASGQLIVPAGKNGLLIGKNGATIQRLKNSTGCQARNINRGETWTVDGPTKIAVETFMQMARQIVGGTSRIISSRELRIVENTMQGGPARPGSEARSAYQAPGRKDDSRCFIATACYGNCEHPDVIALRSWRDRYLLRSSTGQLLVRAYYRLSPPWLDS